MLPLGRIAWQVGNAADFRPRTPLLWQAVRGDGIGMSVLGNGDKNSTRAPFADALQGHAVGSKRQPLHRLVIPTITPTP